MVQKCCFEDCITRKLKYIPFYCPHQNILDSDTKKEKQNKRNHRHQWLCGCQFAVFNPPPPRHPTVYSIYFPRIHKGHFFNKQGSSAHFYPCLAMFRPHIHQNILMDQKDFFTLLLAESILNHQFTNILRLVKILICPLKSYGSHPIPTFLSISIIFYKMGKTLLCLF